MRLHDKLQALITRATAITMGTDTVTDASALLDESNGLWSAISENAVEMLPVVTEMASALKAELETAPEEVKAMLEAFHQETADSRGDWIEPPRPVVAFMVLDAMERIRVHCEHKAKKR